MLVATALALLVPRLAVAHSMGVSYGLYEIHGNEIDVTLKLAPADVDTVQPLDVDGDGVVTPDELRQREPGIVAATRDKLVVEADGKPCDLAHAAPLKLDEAAGSIVAAATYHCPGAGPGPVEHPSRIKVRVGYIADFPLGHRQLAKAQVGAGEPLRVQQFVLDAEHDRLEVEGPPPPLLTVARRFGLLGLEHIFTGYDHLAFLLGLLLLGGRLFALFKIVTSFTVAHSITLALAALDVFAPSPHIVEPAIAASIVYVAVENFFIRSSEKRWRITFAFGLVHGFGFASVLRELGLPRQSLAVSLVSFNLGVEMGQVTVVALVLPLVLYMRRRAWFAAHGVRVLSFAIAAAGATWLVQRIAG